MYAVFFQILRRYCRVSMLAALVLWSNRANADDTETAAQLDRELLRMENRIRLEPDGYASASEYRGRCANNGLHDRSIKFFQDLLAGLSGDRDEWVRIELASAYIDKIPTCSGLTAFMSRGTLARRSLDQLDPVISKNRSSWLAHYCRGMNHLYWPRLLGHTADAIADFKRCIELQQSDLPGSVKPYHVAPYIGLGDAHAKAKQYDQARQAWRDGLDRFPETKELQDRLAIQGDSALLKFVDAKRSLDRPVKTDLSFFYDEVHAPSIP